MAPEGAFLVIALLMVSTSGANQVLILVYRQNAEFTNDKLFGREIFAILRRIADYLALLLLTQGIEPNPGPVAGAFIDNSGVSKKRQSVYDTEYIGDDVSSKDPTPIPKTCLDIYRAKMRSPKCGPYAEVEFNDIVSCAPFLMRDYVRLQTPLDLATAKPRAASTPLSSPLGLAEDGTEVTIHDISAVEVETPSAATSFAAASVIYKHTSHGAQHSVNGKFNPLEYAIMDRYLDYCAERGTPRGRKSYDDSLLEISHTKVLKCERLKKRMRQAENADKRTREIHERLSENAVTKGRIPWERSEDEEEEGYFLTPRQTKKRIGQVKRLFARKQLFDTEPMWAPVVRLVPHPSPVSSDDDDDDEIMDISFTPSWVTFHDTPGMAYLVALAERQDKGEKRRFVDVEEELNSLSIFYQGTSDHPSEECMQKKQEIYNIDVRKRKGHTYNYIKPEYVDFFSDIKRKAEQNNKKISIEQKYSKKVNERKNLGIVKFFRKLFT